MRKSLVCVIALAVMLCACGSKDSADKLAGRRVEGSGTIVEEQRQGDEFNQVSLQGVGDLKVSLGDEQRLLVKAEDNLLPHIVTKVQGRRLLIQFAEGFDDVQ